MEFLTFSYKISSDQSNHRVSVWRTIKEFGAVFLQQGVALLPYTDELYTSLVSLRKRIRSFGGISTLGKLQFLEKDDEREIIDEFTRQINNEYNEFIKNCQMLITELEKESSSGDFNFSEITENEEEYKKFQRWYEKIGRKNYFHSAMKASAASILKKAKEELQKYSDEVFRRDSN